MHVTVHMLYGSNITSQVCVVRPELGLAVLSHTLQWSKYSIVGNVVRASCMLLCLSTHS